MFFRPRVTGVSFVPKPNELYRLVSSLTAVSMGTPFDLPFWPRLMGWWRDQKMGRMVSMSAGSFPLSSEADGCLSLFLYSVPSLAGLAETA